MPEVGQGQLRHGPDAGGGVDEDGKHGLVSQANEIGHFMFLWRSACRDGRLVDLYGSLDRRQKLLGLLGRDVRRLAFDHGIPFCTRRGRRVDDDDVAMDQAVEEPAQGGQVQLLGRGCKGLFFAVGRVLPGVGGSGLQLPQIQAHVARHDVKKL